MFPKTVYSNHNHDSSKENKQKPSTVSHIRKKILPHDHKKNIEMAC